MAAVPQLDPQLSAHCLLAMTCFHSLGRPVAAEALVLAETVAVHYLCREPFLSARVRNCCCTLRPATSKPKRNSEQHPSQIDSARYKPQSDHLVHRMDTRIAYTRSICIIGVGRYDDTAQPNKKLPCPSVPDALASDARTPAPRAASPFGDAAFPLTGGRPPATCDVDPGSSELP
jgi:hypothetical protein